MYVVPESCGSLMVCAEIVGGSLELDVSVGVSAINGTADSGMLIVYVYYNVIAGWHTLHDHAALHEDQCTVCNVHDYFCPLRIYIDRLL